jgi:predicted nucleic acid-binding protein
VITAVDTNVLFGILIPRATSLADSKARLDDALEQGALVISEAVYAELASLFPSHPELTEFLSSTGIRLHPSGAETFWLAGQRWRQYSARRAVGIACPQCGHSETIQCHSCGRTISVRQHVLADFLIGAHAATHADRLLTSDRGYYATYFPELPLV